MRKCRKTRSFPAQTGEDCGVRENSREVSARNFWKDLDFSSSFGY
jgi:hypothetical protein